VINATWALYNSLNNKQYVGCYRQKDWPEHCDGSAGDHTVRTPALCSRRLGAVTHARALEDRVGYSVAATLTYDIEKFSLYLETAGVIKRRL